MADGKNIDIRIKSTADTAGAKAAEKAIDDVTEAAKEADRAIGGTGSGGVAESAKKGKKELEGLAEGATKAAKSSGAMRANMQNLGYQVADVAVQLEGGVSAVRTFTQQGSQMLGVLGPWGAVAGAALAIGGALFSASQRSEEASEDVAEDTEKMSKGMEVLKEFTDDAAEALRMDGLGASNAAFKLRIEAVDALNEKLKRQLDLAKQLRDIELQKQDAGAAAQIAEVEASGIPEEEKSKKVAAIRAEMQERERQRQLNGIRLEEQSARLAVEAAKAKEAAAEINVSANRSNYERNEKEVQEARDAFAKAPDEIAKIQAEMEETKIRKARALLAYGTEGGGEQGGLLRRQIAEKEFSLWADMQNQQPDKLAEKLTEAVKYRDAAKDELKDSEGSLKEAKRESSKAVGKESDVRNLADAQRDLINAQGSSETRISESQRIREEAERRKAADDKAKKDAEKARRDEENAIREQERIRNAGRDLETDITGVGEDAADATRGLGARGINPEGFNTLARKIAKKGDPQGDRLNLQTFLDKVSMLVDAIPDSKSSSEDAEKLRQVERKLEKKIADLSERVRRGEGK